MGSWPHTFAAVDVLIYPCEREAYLSCTRNADTHLVLISKLLRTVLASMPLDRTSPSTALPKVVTTLGHPKLKPHIHHLKSEKKLGLS